MSRINFPTVDNTVLSKDLLERGLVLTSNPAGYFQTGIDGGIYFYTSSNVDEFNFYSEDIVELSQLVLEKYPNIILEYFESSN